MLDNRLNDDLGQHHELLIVDAQPHRPPPDLMGTLLGRNVEHRPHILCNVGRHLQQECALADARIAAHEDTRSRHDTPTQHAAQFYHVQ